MQIVRKCVSFFSQVFHFMDLEKINHQKKRHLTVFHYFAQIQRVIIEPHKLLQHLSREA